MLYVTSYLDQSAEFWSTPDDLHISSSSAISISGVISDTNSPEQKKKTSFFFLIVQFSSSTFLLPSTNLRSRKCEMKINRNFKFILTNPQKNKFWEGSAVSLKSINISEKLIISSLYLWRMFHRFTKANPTEAVSTL
jgi:hypothetical protein